MSLRDPRTLDDLLNFRLARLIGLTGAPVIRLCEGRYGISRREWSIVAVLAAHGPLSPSVLAERSGLDRTRTSRTITSLGAKKLLSRSTEPGDRRRAHVALTPSGQQLYEELFPLIRDIHERSLSVLDAHTLDVIDDALAKLGRHAVTVNRELATEVQANRRHGSTRHRWTDATTLPAPSRREDKGAETPQRKKR